jgi:hypothetical protein
METLDLDQAVEFLMHPVTDAGEGILWQDASGQLTKKHYETNC